MKPPALLIALSVVSTAAFAAKPCEELKTEIAAKLDAKQVSGYTLEIVANDQVGDRKVVGSCEGGARKIVYQKHGDAQAQDDAAGAAPIA
jgi:hypothetical protein